MHDDLLSIGEFARLRGVSVKSLRYYERMGVLKPAYVDPSSGYRYYVLSQAAELDVVQTFIELGIPIKEMLAFCDGDGRLDVQGLIEQGRGIARRRAHEASVVLAQMDAYAAELDFQAAIARDAHTYRRTFRERRALVMPWDARGFDRRRYVRDAAALYEMALDLGLAPLYSQGVIERADAPEACVDDENATARRTRPGMRGAYVEVEALRDEPDAIAQAAPHAEERGGLLASIPGGTFSCRRIEGSGAAACFVQAEALAERAHGLAIAAEIWNASPSDGAFTLELQML